MHDKLYDILSQEYKKVVDGRDFVYAEGTIPILLVAHVDTVHHELPKNLFYDSQKMVAWSPTGLGADDRAGVMGILHLLSLGYRPHVLFCDGEEKGGYGATEASKAIKPKVKYVIELDRNGKKDAVFYDCDNSEFTKYVESFGFKEDWGSFSDISFLCPKWRIAGVNLSTGYYGAHTTSEYLRVDELVFSLEKVSLMLSTPPEKKFTYMASKKGYGNFWGSDYYDYYDLYDRESANKKKSSSKTKNSSPKTSVSTKASTVIKHNYICVYVGASDLQGTYGGTITRWNDFLGAYKTTIEDYIRNKIYQAAEISDCLSSKTPEDLKKELASLES